MTFVGTLSPYPTVVTVWTAHHSPDPRDGKLWWSTTVMRSPAATVIDVDAIAMTMPAPRGVDARASILSSRRSSLVLSAIDVTFALSRSGPSSQTFTTLRSVNACERNRILYAIRLREEGRRRPMAFGYDVAVIGRSIGVREWPGRRV